MKILTFNPELWKRYIKENEMTNGPVDADFTEEPDSPGVEIIDKKNEPKTGEVVESNDEIESSDDEPSEEEIITGTDE